MHFYCRMWGVIWGRRSNAGLLESSCLNHLTIMAAWNLVFITTFPPLQLIFLDSRLWSGAIVRYRQRLRIEPGSPGFNSGALVTRPSWYTKRNLHPPFIHSSSSFRTHVPVRALFWGIVHGWCSNVDLLITKLRCLNHLTIMAAPLDHHGTWNLIFILISAIPLLLWGRMHLFGCNCKVSSMVDDRIWIS